MKRNILSYLLVAISVISFCIFVSCESDDTEPDPIVKPENPDDPNNPENPGKPDDPNKPDDPTGKNLKRTILLYAVASNDLYGNLLDDKKEILKAAESMNLDGLSMLVYEVIPKQNAGSAYPDYPVLRELTRKNGKCEFEIIKEYDKSLYSTDPDRIREVIEDVAEMRDADNFGLILWSHGTGIDPTGKTRSENSGILDIELPFMYSFGSDTDRDRNPNYKDRIDVDELADAIPDGMFDFIWFDACYMSGIETIYELRDKCDYFVGYPTEVFVPGMPYHLTTSFFLKENADLKGAAKAFFDYYNDYPTSDLKVATVAVADMNKIEKVADFCKEVYKDADVVSAKILQCYTRGSIGPFYDFGQYTRLKCESAGLTERIAEFNTLMDEFVIWKAATDVDFNYWPISKDNYSGISCHVFNPVATDKKTEFFKTLDWYKRVY